MTASRLGFIGAGHMNCAIIKGLLENDTPISLKNIAICCKTDTTKTRLKTQFNLSALPSISDVVKNARILVIGVKPAQVHEVLCALAKEDLSDHLIITLAAGLPLEAYRRVLGDELHLVRAMPNIAAACQSSLTGLYCDLDLSTQEIAQVEAIFEAIGSIIWLDDETQMDGITALAGSGIAYFFKLMQAMQQAGERYGFTQEELFDILGLTALGAATMAVEDNHTQDFASFVTQIATPNGTTAQAIQVFEAHKLNEVVEQAMNAVVKKSNELASTLTKDW